MDIASVSTSLYEPILPYQTRLIRLHGDQHDRDSPLACDLLTADILHSDFEGLGVRSLGGTNDQLVSYQALSYTWGTSEEIETILCNGVEKSITQHLSEALQALRFHGDNTCFLWVDAISINQRDEKEKSAHIPNMKIIFEKARVVIGWLGNPPVELENVLHHAATLDLKGIVKGLTFLYSRPWFRRIWVQQEIYAARILSIYCGNIRLSGELLRWNPAALVDFLSSELHKLPGMDADPLAKLFEIPEFMRKSNQLHESGPSMFIESGPSPLEDIRVFRLDHLRCFDIFASPHCPQPDLIDALLQTGQLNATDPRDYIYGILAMTKFSARAQSIANWLITRRSQESIPIDYSANTASILSAVTWTLLMKCGFTLLAKLKCFSLKKEEEISNLPSWAIDWRSTANQVINVTPVKGRERKTMDNPWNALPDNSSIIPPPKQHLDFCVENISSSLPSNKIIVRGKVDKSIYVSKGNLVYCRSGHKKIPIGFPIEVDDIVAYFLPFRRMNDNWPHMVVDHGWWLLRPKNNEEFRILGFMPSPRIDMNNVSLYGNWQMESTDQYRTASLASESDTLPDNCVAEFESYHLMEADERDRFWSREGFHTCLARPIILTNPPRSWTLLCTKENTIPVITFVRKYESSISEPT